MKIVNLHPDKLCDTTGKLVHPEELSELSCALLSGDETAVVLFTPPADGVIYPQGSFGNYCSYGMLVWDYASTEMQERYLGGLMTGKFFPGGRRLFEFPNLKTIFMHDDLDRVQLPITACLQREAPEEILKSFLKHEEIFIGESGSSRDEEFDRKNICHIFMRHIMFTQPQIQHAFGNSAELVFCRRVKTVDPLLAAPLDEALKSCFVPLQKEVL